MQWFPLLCLPVCWSLPLYHLNLVLIPSSVFLFQLLYLQLYLVPYIFSLLNFSPFVSGSSNLSSVLKKYILCLFEPVYSKKKKKKKGAQDICKFIHSSSICSLALSALRLSPHSPVPRASFFSFSDYKDGLSIEDLAPHVSTPLYAALWLGSTLAAKHRRKKSGKYTLCL